MTTLIKARNRITTLWFAGTFAIVLLLVVQSISNRYEGRAAEVWKWGLPLVLPTALLMLGVHAGTRTVAEVATPAADVVVDPLFYWVTLGSSALYLCAVLGVLLKAAIHPGTEDPITFMEQASWLSMLQALPTGAFGYLYAKR